MTFTRNEYDAIVVGGGFYGCCLALTLRERFRHVLVVEREAEPLMRASYANQARVHNGYHYPRSLLTARRSAVNYPLFLNEFEECVDRSFTKVYAIARGTSKVSAYQFQKFCERVGVPARRTPNRISRLFDSSLIEETFVTEECAFNAVKLRGMLRRRLDEAGVELVCGIEVDRVLPGRSTPLLVSLSDGGELAASCVFNSTYSQLNQVLARSGLPRLPLKHEMTELALVDVPAEIKDLGITVMDGPFFSTMPFPALGLHTLSHVTYTPHVSWNDLEREQAPTFKTDPTSKHIFMIRDAARYMPLLAKVRYVHSHFEVKTVLMQNEVDDGRPIMCRRNHGLDGLHVVLGAKIDNIYDIIQTLKAETLVPEVSCAIH